MKKIFNLDIILAIVWAVISILFYIDFVYTSSIFALCGGIFYSVVAISSFNICKY
jgi:hypothetical protein